MFIGLLIGFLLLIIYLWICLKSPARTLELAAKIPGPKGLPIFGNIFLKPFSGPRAMENSLELIKTHGPIVRLWLGNELAIMLSSPEDCEAILNDTKLLDKPIFYKFLHNWIGTGLLTSTGTKWHKRRKALTPTFHFKILEQFVDIFNENGDILIDCLKKRTNQLKESVDFLPYLINYTLDVLCETAMDKKINAQTDTESTYLDAFTRILHATSERINKPWLYNNFAYAISGYLSEENKAIKVLRNLSDDVIASKQTALENEFKNNAEKKSENEEENFGMKKRTAFLELLLRKKLEGSPEFVTNADIREEVDTFIFEGHDTSKSGIGFTLYCLAKYPDIQEKVYEELINILGPENRTPTFEDLQKMKYLEQVIKEVIRLYPPVPMFGRAVTREVTLPSGYTLPVGSIIVLFAYGCHRNEKYFPNPTVFNPDHFTAENSSKRHPFSYLPFSAGPRNCIGQKFAMLEMKAITTKLLLNFRLELEPNWKMQLDSRLVLKTLNGFRFILKDR